MAFYQVKSPDLSSISLGGSVLRLLEGYGFTSDESHILVRGTYTDDGDPSFGLHYGVWLYDIENQSYVSNLNEQIAGVNGARDIDVLEVQTSGSSDNLLTVALVNTKGTDSTRLVSLFDGEVQTNNLIQSVTGVEIEVKVEKFLLSDDGRFLAIQSSSEQLAADDGPDTNDSSDIYLLDLTTNSVTRVSYLGGSEVFNSTFLKDIHVEGSEVKIAFVTDAAFVSPTKKDLNSGQVSNEENFRSDAYIWSSNFNANGLVGDFTFELLSKGNDDIAAGFVDRDNNVQITNAGGIFTSKSPDIDPADFNNANDSFFVDNDGQIKRIVIDDGNELDNGSIFLSASNNGEVISYLSSSAEVSGATGAQQMVKYDKNNEFSDVISKNGNIADNWVTSGDLSESGYSRAFTSSALNLTNNALETTAGDLFLSISDYLPLTGQVYHWKSHALMQGVSLTLSERADQNSDVLTIIDENIADAAGGFNFIGDVAGVKNISADKLVTDDDLNRVINSADALAALKIAVGLNPNSDDEIPVSPYQFISADVNQDQKVNSADALQILKMAVGLSDAIAPDWLFVNESALFWDYEADDGEGEFVVSKNNVVWEATGIDVYGAPDADPNFVAMLLGDVNGSWKPQDEENALPASYFVGLDADKIGPEFQWFSEFIA
jgi:hypothetical protein